MANLRDVRSKENENSSLTENTDSSQMKISELSSQVSMLKNKISEIQLDHQSEIADMNAEISALQKQNLALTKNNDDLRNRNGLKSREQQKQLEDALTSAMDRISADDEKHKREIFQIRLDCDKRIKQAENHAAEIESRRARDNEIAAKARKEGEEYRDRYKQLLADEEAHIDELAERKIAEEKAAIHREQDLETAQIKKKYDRRLNMRIHSLDARCQCNYPMDAHTDCIPCDQIHNYPVCGNAVSELS